MRVAVVGTGAVGGRVLRRLAEEPDLSEVLVCGHRESTSEDFAGAVRGVQPCRFGDLHTADVVVLATPSGTHWPLALRLMQERTAVVSVSDHPEEVRGLLSMDSQAASLGVPMLLGAAFSPGLSCVLARHASADFDEVTAVHVARHGAAGPSCARSFHKALKRPGFLRRNGVWLRRSGGSGRELSWFPDPVGPVDCYFGELSEPWLLSGAFPSAGFITARRAAARQDRLTSWLPMLAPPVLDGGLGAVRVEIRGVTDGESVVKVVGSAHGPAAAAASVAAQAALALCAGEALRPGAMGLAEALNPLKFLQSLKSEGINPVLFEGSGL